MFNNIKKLKSKLSRNINLQHRESSGGPVVRIQHFHCRAWVLSLVGELRPRKPRGMAKKFKKKFFLIKKN